MAKNKTVKKTNPTNKGIEVKNVKTSLGGVLESDTTINNRSVESPNENIEIVEPQMVDGETPILEDPKVRQIVVPQQVMDLSNKLVESGKKQYELNIEAIKLHQEKMVVVQKEMFDLTTIVQSMENEYVLMENELLKEKAKLDTKKAEYTNLQFQMLIENKKNEAIMAQVNGYNKGLTEGLIIAKDFDLTKVTNLKKGTKLVFDYIEV
jgi:predicted double-glycine peptidase